MKQMVVRRLRQMRDDERGEILPFVILGAVFVMMIAGGVGMYRIGQAKANIDNIAQSSARWASLERSASAGRSAALQRIDNAVADRGLACKKVSSSVDVSQFNRRVGRYGKVTTNVTCVVKLSDLLVPGLPGSVAVTATGFSEIDRYRERD